MKQIHITKASGQETAFDPQKLHSSLTRAGADEETARKIIHDISTDIYEGIPTRKIHKLAFKQLKQLNQPVAGKYKLKRAIMQLGPSGFPFEKFIGEIFKVQQYSILLNQSVQGYCVTHELDITAAKEGVFCIIECKYHNLQATICDVKIPLYIYARFQDIVQNLSVESKLNYEGWIVTNTKFSDDAIRFGTCRGLKLLSWAYPLQASLKDLIDKFKIYPVTCLTTVSSKERVLLMERNIILCKEVLGNRSVLSEIGINTTREKNIILDAENICKG